MFCLFILISCGERKTPTEKEYLKFLNIKVTSAGVDEKNSFCKNFNLTDKQAALFFERSHKITTKTMHDKYDYLPCYVKGTSSLKEMQCEWEVRAGGTAEVSCGKSNYMLACNKCDALFKD